MSFGNLISSIISQNQQKTLNDELQNALPSEAFYEEGEIERKIQEAVEKSEQAISRIKHLIEHKSAYYDHYLHLIEAQDNGSLSQGYSSVTPQKNFEANFKPSYGSYGNFNILVWQLK